MHIKYYIFLFVLLFECAVFSLAAACTKACSFFDARLMNESAELPIIDTICIHNDSKTYLPIPDVLDELSLMANVDMKCRISKNCQIDSVQILNIKIIDSRLYLRNSNDEYSNNVQSRRNEIEESVTKAAVDFAYIYPHEYAVNARNLSPGKSIVIRIQMVPSKMGRDFGETYNKSL